tara:strand:+ start:306 stop:710 length:405 start_codon:yes stop_codon:yes gene_type:complete
MAESPYRLTRHTQKDWNLWVASLGKEGRNLLQRSTKIPDVDGFPTEGSIETALEVTRPQKKTYFANVGNVLGGLISLPVVGAVNVIKVVDASCFDNGALYSRTISDDYNKLTENIVEFGIKTGYLVGKRFDDLL